jgi:hypothetical protein
VISSIARRLGRGEGRQFERCAAAFRRQRQETVEDRFVVLAGQQLVIIGADAEIERGADSCYMRESLRQWSGMTDFRTLWVEVCVPKTLSGLVERRIG